MPAPMKKQDDGAVLTFEDILVPGPTNKRKPIVSECVAAEARNLPYEVTSLEGEEYITLRSLSKRFGKRADNLARRLQGRGVPILMLQFINSRRELRDTPCVPKDQAQHINSLMGDKINVVGRKGWVYFVQQGEDGPIKIGWSVNPSKRFISLQTSNPDPLRLLGTLANQTTEDEQRLLDEFKDLNIRGEWFRPEQKLLQRIGSLLGTNPV